MAQFRIANKLIGDKQPCFIIAEIGQNHQGNIDIAKRMIEIAKECGADCVKFQKSCLEEKFTKCALERIYTGSNSWGNTYGEHKRHLEFSVEEYKDLQSHADKIGILFTASAMDHVSLLDLYNLKVPFIKIGSGDANNYAMISKAASLEIPLIISTGMQNLNTVNEIYNIVNKCHTNFSLLHCVSSYPTRPVDVNLKVLRTYTKMFPDIVIGYSGHELGTMISLGAVAMGAKIIERHFTLDKTLKGSDHICSLTPEELKLLVANIRDMENKLHRENIAFSNDLEVMEFVSTNFEEFGENDLKKIKCDMLLALGSSVKQRLICEIPCFDKLGKSIVYKRNLTNGHKITESDICIKVSEPKGLSGENINEIIGKTLSVEASMDAPVLDTDFI